MATREERLLGYQLVKVTDVANYGLIHAGYVMRGLVPFTDDPFMQPVNPENPDDDTTQVATLEYQKDVSTKILDGVYRYSTMAGEFISRYGKPTEIQNGLVAYNVGVSDVTDDVSALATHKTNADTAVSLSVDKETLSTSGELLCLYEPKMVRHVNPELIPSEERNYNALQDVINATCINLRGLCSDTGAVLFTKAKDIQELAKKRTRVARNHWDSRCYPGNPVTDPMNTAITYFENEIDGAANLTALASLSDYVESIVPQLPLARRWWYF